MRRSERKKLTKPPMKRFFSASRAFVSSSTKIIIIRAIINGTSFVVASISSEHTTLTHDARIHTCFGHSVERFNGLTTDGKEEQIQIRIRIRQKAPHMIYCGFYYFPMVNIINTCDHLIMRIYFYFINFFRLRTPTLRIQHSALTHIPFPRASHNDSFRPFFLCHCFNFSNDM